MKGDPRLSYPVLKDEKLEFFYGILTLWESGKDPKIINNFKSEGVTQLKKRKDNKGHPILRFSDFNDKNPLQLSEIRFKDVKGNKGLSILSHLRHAFAHNRITVEENGRILHIKNEYRGDIKFNAVIAFDVLKDLMETLTKQDNNVSKENKNKTKTKGKQKSK